MLDALLTAADLADDPAVLVARASRLSDDLSLDAWRPCLLLLDAPLPPQSAALRHYPPDHAAKLIIDRPDGLQTRETALANLHSVPADALAAALPAVPQHDVRNHPEGLRGVIQRLRNPDGGCPWDNAQTHLSLRTHLLEEAYETLDAIADAEPAALCEELGDLLMQVALHARLAEQDDAFDLGDVSEGIRAKLVRRHPHVFGDANVESAAAMEQVWERLKARERPSRESVLDGIPRTLPALARAQSTLGRAARNGLPRTGSRAKSSTAIGEQLLDLVEAAREANISAEDAARDALEAFEHRVRNFEATLRNEGHPLDRLTNKERTHRWSQTH